MAEIEPAAGRMRSRLLVAPSRWPVRWRIAAISAGLTLLILVAFAVVVGRLASDRLESDFEDEVVVTANEIASEIEISADAFGQPHVSNPTPIPSDGEYRVVLASGFELDRSEDVPQLPDPEPGLTRVDDLTVVTSPVVATLSGPAPVFVQYAEDRTDLNNTTDWLWLFLGLGVIGGTVLATLAGLAIANRAMRPISDLTATARKIAATRDPSQRVPQPASDDEVAELARTLDQMLRELDAARTETEHMVQAQREFVADASHELRTPLTSILANLELLQEELSATDDEGEQGEMVASALRSSRRMRRLVGDLLLLARADAGRMGAREEVDLAEVAEAAVREVQPAADGRVIELTAGAPVPVEANPDELHRLVLNLLDNALRHTPPEAEVRVAVEPRDGHALLEVADDGPGIPAGLGDQVFSRFVRGGGAADLAPDSGTGLGLAIVRAIAVAHGGSVEAGSSASGGARLTVTLPSGTERSDSEAAARESAAPPRAGSHV